MTTEKNTRELAEKYSGTKWLRCGACGTTTKVERGDALVCPFCKNSPQEVVLDGGLLYLGDEEARRWL